MKRTSMLKPALSLAIATLLPACALDSTSELIEPTGSVEEALSVDG